MKEENPTPVNFMYLNSDWEASQKEQDKQLNTIVDILNLLLILV